MFQGRQEASSSDGYSTGNVRMASRFPSERTTDPKARNYTTEDSSNPNILFKQVREHSLPPVPAVEVIESEPCFCVCVRTLTVKPFDI